MNIQSIKDIVLKQLEGTTDGKEVANRVLDAFTARINAAADEIAAYALTGNEGELAAATGRALGFVRAREQFRAAAKERSIV